MLQYLCLGQTNDSIVDEILDLRRENAEILGFKNHGEVSPGEICQLPNAKMHKCKKCKNAQMQKCTSAKYHEATLAAYPYTYGCDKTRKKYDSKP